MVGTSFPSVVITSDSSGDLYITGLRSPVRCDDRGSANCILRKILCSGWLYRLPLAEVSAGRRRRLGGEIRPIGDETRPRQIARIYTGFEQGRFCSAWDIIWNTWTPCKGAEWSLWISSSSFIIRFSSFIYRAGRMRRELCRGNSCSMSQAIGKKRCISKQYTRWRCSGNTRHSDTDFEAAYC